MKYLFELKPLFLSNQIIYQQLLHSHLPKSEPCVQSRKDAFESPNLLSCWVHTPESPLIGLTTPFLAPTS